MDASGQQELQPPPPPDWPSEPETGVYQAPPPPPPPPPPTAAPRWVKGTVVGLLIVVFLLSAAVIYVLGTRPPATADATPTGTSLTAASGSPSLLPGQSAATSESPSLAPGETPSLAPGETASLAPGETPSLAPGETASPTASLLASASPSVSPSASASLFPSDSPSPSPTASPTQAPTASPTQVPTATPTQPPQFIEFGDDIYSIPAELAPGTYRTRHTTSDCYWARLSGFSGLPDDIIANSFGDGFQVVTIKATDKGFESDGCDLWSSDLSRVTASTTQFGLGTFIVGVDILPGTYRSSGASNCYWARLSGFGGQVSDIIANDIVPGGHPKVTISAGDEGFTSHGCGTWVRQ